MADQKISDAALLKLEGELTKRFDSVRGQLKILQETIDGLEGHWKGIGAGAFNTKQEEINRNMASLARRLLKFQEAIKAARVISGNTEDEVRQALQGIDVVGGYSGDAAAEARASSLNNF
ncbi:WXG100 family type VII secretion target [Streptomyces sp. NPDC057499]|uniref:WXG100 family type VII secretion target n=1 Tax=Streptomyces sp. NPDC057499 TaxID=3346150 RepID=UPI00367414E6